MAFILLAIPKPDRIKKDNAFGAALEGEPRPKLVLGVYDRNFLMLVGFALAVYQYANLPQFVFDHQIDPFVKGHFGFRFGERWTVR